MQRNIRIKAASALRFAVMAAALAPVAAQAQNVFTSVASTSTLSGVTSFSAARINDSGTVAFVGSGAYYTASGGTTTRLLGNGDATPLGSTYSAIDTLYYSLDNSGRLTFASTMATGGGITSTNNRALFVRNTNGTITTVLQTGTTILPGGSTTNSIGGYSANNNGAIAVQLSNPSYAIYEYSGSGAFNGASTVVSAGQSAPGATGGAATFSTFAFPSLDNNGNVTYFTNLNGDPISNSSEYRSTATGTATKVMAGGDAAPGTGTPTDYFNFAGKIVSNDASQSAFSGGAVPVSISGGTITIGSPQVRGIWFGQADGTLSPVALQGQNDLDPNGGTFTAGGASGASFTLGNLNNSGTGVFYASGLSGTMTAADYMFTSSGYSLLLGIGQSLFGSTVTALGQPAINNAGQVVGNYTLANGTSGIFLYSAATGTAAAPEPISLAVMGFGGLVGGISTIRRRKRSGRNA